MVKESSIATTARSDLRSQLIVSTLETHFASNRIRTKGPCPSVNQKKYAPSKEEEEVCGVKCEGEHIHTCGAMFPVWRSASNEQVARNWIAIRSQTLNKSWGASRGEMRLKKYATRSDRIFIHKRTAPPRPHKNKSRPSRK